MIMINSRAAIKQFSRYCPVVNPEDVKYKINSDYIHFNCINAAECYREMMVSFLPMLPLINNTVDMSEADYILYAHPFARSEDMSPSVIAQLHYIDKNRKEGAEIIVVGKAANVEPLLNGSISNITFYESHFTEALGKRFEMDIKDEYMVYDTYSNRLCMWPVNGCLRKCKFCRRTYMNIPFESVSLETIKRDLDLIKATAPDLLTLVNLRAENLTEYGLDIYGKPALPELIKLLDSYDEIRAISIVIGVATCETTKEILESFCNCKKFVRINLNPEVGSNRLLDIAGKDVTRERNLYIFKELRKAHPDLLIDSTIMIGFPTETLEDIYELADFIGQTEPDFILCNFVEIAPKSLLADLPPLSDNLKQYHLELLISLLKKQKRSRDLEIKYSVIPDTSKRSGHRFKQLADRRMKEYSLLALYRRILHLDKNGTCEFINSLSQWCIDNNRLV